MRCPQIRCKHWRAAIAARFTLGNFSNYLTRSFKEPRLLVVMDPRVDFQATREAAYVNIPAIALCETDTPLQFVDVVIPSNKARHLVVLIWYMLCREVLCFRGTASCTKDGWDIMVDMYFYRDSEEVERQQQEEAFTTAVADQPEVISNTEWSVGAAAQAGAI